MLETERLEFTGILKPIGIVQYTSKSHRYIFIELPVHVQRCEASKAQMYVLVCIGGDCVSVMEVVVLVAVRLRWWCLEMVKGVRDFSDSV